MNKIIKVYKDLSKPIKATLWFTLSNIVLKGISFITVPIFTRLLSETEYGQLSLFMSYEQFFLIFATWEIQAGAYQKGIFNYKEDINTYTTSTILLINLLTTVFFLGLVLFLGPISKFTQIPSYMFLVLWVYFLFQPSYSTWLVRQRTNYKYRSVVFTTILFTLVNVLVPILALNTINRTAEVKYLYGLFASIGVCLIFYLPIISYLRRLNGKWRLVREQWLFMIRFEAPLVLHSLSYLILNQADRVMIGKMVGHSEAAFYSVAYNLASVISLFQVSINQALLPWRYQMLEQKRYHDIKRVTNIVLILFGTIILLFVLVSPEIMKLLFTSNYYEALWCIPPVALSIFFMFLYTIFVNIETYFEKTKYVMYVSIVCGPINIVLNYIGIQLFGYIACAYATLISYILFSLGHYIFTKKVITEKGIQVSQLIDRKIILLISGTMIALTVGITYLYQSLLLRYIFIIALLTMAFVKRGLIKSMLKTIKG